jgi:hypothetical protein
MMQNLNAMCGRIIQASSPPSLPRRYNGAPSQELLVIRQNHETGERSSDLLK